MSEFRNFRIRNSLDLRNKVQSLDNNQIATIAEQRAVPGTVHAHIFSFNEIGAFFRQGEAEAPRGDKINPAAGSELTQGRRETEKGAEPS